MVESKTKRESDGISVSGALGIRSLLWRPRVLLLIGLALAATVVVPKVLESVPELGDRPEYELRVEAVELVPSPPGWVPDRFLSDVVSSDLWPQSGSSVFAPDLAKRVSESFAARAWVSEVVRVERRVPSGVMVRLVYRRPVAWIETTGLPVAVDVGGVRLPREDLQGESGVDYPVVRGITSEAPAADALVWDDPAVLASARLADELGLHWAEFGLSAIVVRPGRDKDGDPVFLELLTRGGSRVMWGRPPGTRHPGELTVRQKIGRIEQFISHFESLDPPDGPYEINIRHWREIIYRPLKSESARRMTLRVVR
jgi:hypothetical protein